MNMHGPEGIVILVSFSILAFGLTLTLGKVVQSELSRCKIQKGTGGIKK